MTALENYINEMDAAIDNLFGLSAMYVRGQLSVPVTVLPQREWVGDVSGEFVYNVDRSIWSLDLRVLQSAGVTAPARGDMLILTRENISPERYLVIYHDKNNCWTYQHGLNQRNRILIYTQEVKQ